jgi:hypothetical protein
MCDDIWIYSALTLRSYNKYSGHSHVGLIQMTLPRVQCVADQIRLGKHTRFSSTNWTIIVFFLKKHYFYYYYYRTVKECFTKIFLHLRVSLSGVLN